MPRAGRLAMLFLALCLSAASQTAPPATAPPQPSPLEDAFQTGWMLVDTNGDGIADFVSGKIVVPAAPGSAENAAAANLAARMGYGTTGLTLPVVLVATAPEAAAAPHKLYVGRAALPAAAAARLAPLEPLLGVGEGGVFLLGGDLAVVGRDDAGLLAAANAYAAHAPYQWAAPGPRLEEIARGLQAALEAAKLKATVTLLGVNYAAGQPGIQKAILHVTGTSDRAAIERALIPEGRPPISFPAVRALVLLLDEAPPVVLVNPSPQLPPAPGPLPLAGPKQLDLGRLYTIHGLLGGQAKMPLPTSVDVHLYVPAGAPGVAMANLAARLGLETTGIALPLAFVADGVTPAQVKTNAVLTETSPLGRQLVRQLTAERTGSGQPFGPAVFPPLAPGQGELRVLDRAFGRHAALLVRGDEAGQVAALDDAAARLPFLWEPDKRYASLDELRDELHRFFSLRSAAGQAAAALYHLERWVQQAEASPARPAKLAATVYVDDVDPQLGAFLQHRLEQLAPGARVQVRTGSLHAGLKCCARDPALYYVSTLHPFQPSEPTFRERFAIPWEGNRLLEAVRRAAAGRLQGQPAVVRAEVSESPTVRRQLGEQIRQILRDAGADPQHIEVSVLSAYKPGLSWLLEEVAPELAGRPVARVVIEFAPYEDPDHTSLLFSRTRWLQELYPADALLAQVLHLPLEQIQFQALAAPGGPTYRVRAYAGDGRLLLERTFTVHTAPRPYSNEFPQYDHVEVDTGWVQLRSADRTLLDARVPTDAELFWEHYQTVTLPHIFHFLMAQYDGDPRLEDQPLFDTLLLRVHLSEPDLALGLYQQRISSLEALEEDIFYSTCNFFYMLGTLNSTGLFDYMGRVIPVVYPSTEGRDGEVEIEFYAKDGPRPLVALDWTDAAGHTHHDKRELPPLRMEPPRAVAALVRAGQPGLERLEWELPVDARQDRYRDWILRQPATLVEHTMFSAEQGEGLVRALGALQRAGLYRDTLAYGELRELAVAFRLPRPLRAPEQARPDWVTAAWPLPSPPAPRPQITDYRPAPLPAAATDSLVTWEEPISPEKSAEILARLAQFPGVKVYWMGRSYLGENLWAADILLPSPARLLSVAKLDTLKATIIYSGRQHANEVSSTSHLLRLAELLVRDPATRAALRKVNVVIHPIDNPDGANLSMRLMQITPDFMLHPGYHGALTADVQSGMWEPDPVYPESRTRRQLWEAWLPDAFLNPHGYPSHEWVQPFSGYTAWVTRRTGVETGYSWWIPRGWFTSLGYLADPEHALSKDVAYELRERIVDAINQVPGAAELNAWENALYQRYGVDWEPRRFQQPVYKGVRIYMALKGQTAAPGGGGFLARFPDVTWDEGYTEAPDETAHGAYLHLVAAMGLAYDRVHLDYLAGGQFKITRSEKLYADGVEWKLARQRPVLPAQWRLKPGPGVEDQPVQP
jgi:hypothetical protein